MRVLHIDTERGWRGGERQALWLAMELERRGHHSLVAARPGEPLATRAREAVLAVHDCAPAFEGDPRAVVALRHRIVESGIEIVHAHTAHAVGVGALALLGLDIPLVASRRVDFHLRRNLGTRWKYGRVGAIIAISRAVAEILASDGIERDRITVVPDGTDVHRHIAAATREVLASLGVPAGAPLAVQVAQLVAHKDPLNFVSAIAAARRRIPTLHGLLVGDGPLRVEVEAAARKLGLEHAVHLAGYRQDADTLLAAADVVVLSSREEGMGSVLLDALLLGKAIAATRAGGIPEVIDDAVTGLLAPVGDPVTLGAHIGALLEDPTLGERLGRAARLRASDFSVERMTDRTLAVYERVDTRGASGARDATKRRTDAATRTSSASSIRAP